MVLKYQVEKLDDLDEAVRALYVEKDGKFTLELEGLPKADNSGVMGDLVRERKTRKALEDKVKRWEASGKTPEEIDELLDKQAELEAKRAADEGNYEKMVKQAVEKSERALKAERDARAKAEAEKTAAEKRAEDQMISYQIANALGKHGGKSYLNDTIRKRIKVEQTDDGREKILILDDQGVTKVSADGKPMTIDEFVAEMKSTEEFGGAFIGSGASGSGARQANGGGNGASQIKRKSDIKGNTTQERIKARDEWIKTHATEAEGVAAWGALPP